MIYRIFRADAKRLTKNVVAIVVIMGLAVIPSLYAWFNILSNWDPYGETATSQMKIAVFSEDQGVSFGGLELNVGDQVCETLAGNSSIDWILSESKDQAMEGVNSGEYYAALIIPDEFTEDLVSFVYGNPRQASLEYYSNDKKNAIASKITSKVKTTIQTQINDTYVSTLAKIITESGEILTSEGAGNLVLLMNDRLDQLDQDLLSYESLLRTFLLTTEAVDGLLESSQSVFPEMQLVVDSSGQIISDMENIAAGGDDAVLTAQDLLNNSLGYIDQELGELQEQLLEISLPEKLSLVNTSYDSISAAISSTMDMLEEWGFSDSQAYQQAQTAFAKLQSDFEKLKADGEFTQEELEEIRLDIIAGISSYRQTIGDLQLVVIEDTNGLVGRADISLKQAASLLENLNGDFAQIGDAVSQYRQVLVTSNNSILAAADYIAQLRDGIQGIRDQIDNIESGTAYQEISQLLQMDPETIASFIASPITISTQPIYEIENYGSAMTPFYTVLALWVGALILVAILRPKVIQDDEFHQQVGNAKNWQCFFGRYIIFFLIAEVQAIITVLGNLFYIQIDCAHPLFLIFTAIIVAFVFSMFMYALTYAFGNVGQAIAVVVMVIQVAGAGGTFPIEVLPNAYQMIYKFLPFTYSLGAMRECIGGIYQMDYWRDLGMLGIYVIISLLIGLFVGKPFARLMDMIEQSKKRSGIMF